VDCVPIKSRVLRGRIFSLVRIGEGLLRIFFRAARHKADIYIPVGFLELLIAFTVSRFSKTILIYNANELEGDRHRVNTKWLNTLLNWVVRVLEGAILRRVDRVIAADYERARLMEQWHTLSEVALVRNVPLYQPVSDENLIRKHLRIPVDHKVLLYQGMIVKGRGLEVAIMASAHVRGGVFSVVLLGFVTQAYRLYLEAIAQNSGFTRLRFLPPVPWQDLHAWTCSADISFVLIEPLSISYSLAAPNKLYESIMAERPYIASDLPEIRRVHEVAEAGILVDPRDTTAIAAAIETLITDDAVTLQHVAHARKAKQIFNWDREKEIGRAHV